MDNKKLASELVKLAKEIEGGSEVSKRDVDKAIKSLLDIYKNVTSKLESMDVNKGAAANESIMETIEYLKTISKTVKLAKELEAASLSRDLKEKADDLMNAITIHARKQGKKSVLSRVTGVTKEIKNMIKELNLA